MPSRREFRPILGGTPEKGDTGVHLRRRDERDDSSSDESIVEVEYGDILPYTADVKKFSKTVYPSYANTGYRPASLSVKTKNREGVL